MAFWLLVERLENRLVDENQGFRRFGVPGRQERMASEIRRGDILVFYVSSGVSAISDIRRAAADGVQRLRHGGDYDTAYPLAIATEPDIILPRDKWLPFKDVAQSLSLTAGKDWRQAMRLSIRRLSDQDGGLLVAEVRRRSEEPR